MGSKRIQPATTIKEQRTLAYWELSLAWKNVGNWAQGLTWEGFSRKVRDVCCDQGKVGLLADSLLDDAINDIERRPNEISGSIYHLFPETKKISQQLEA